jgi:transposase InsO family protein
MTNNAKLHIGELRKHSDEITRKGQLVISDVCGPFPTSVEGYRYVVSFTDVYSRFSACYMLRKKSETAQALRALIKFFKRHGIVLETLRSDQGGEYGGHQERASAAGESGGVPKRRAPGPRGEDDDEAFGTLFESVCVENDIKHELMPAHRPELHGLAERWNRTVTKMANSMLYAARLSCILWPSAFAHANMLRNRLPIRGLGALTPYEIFHGRRPRVDNLRVFGCDCYKLLPTYPKIPGQASRKRLIYVGETADRVGFRCFDPINFQFTTEFELTFDERSARKRINALREYDLRRELQRRGQLEGLALEPDDFAIDEQMQKMERND